MIRHKKYSYLEHKQGTISFNKNWPKICFKKALKKKVIPPFHLHHKK